VFAMIAASAARLCDAYDALVLHTDGDALRLVAHEGRLPTTDPVGHATLRLTRGAVMTRAVLDRRTIQVADMHAVGDEYPEGSDLALRLGHRTILAVPLIRAGTAIGVIALRRTEVRPFIDRQIALLETFADQAVIAIENTRLFEAERARTNELMERTGELAEALEYQTATSDVLAVISRSKFDLQPVLDTIATIASRLCAANDAIIFLREGDDLRTAAHYGSISATFDTRRPIGRGWVAGRTVVDRKAIHVSDLASAGDEFPIGRELAIRIGHRTTLGIPLLRDDIAIGCLLLRRKVVQPFVEKQITLLQTFADQAVIAIENTRLFEEVKSRTRQLTEALEQQTAMSEVLSIISSSPGELQPVFKTMLKTAIRLCDANFGVFYLTEGDALRVMAMHGAPPAYVDRRSREPVFRPPPETSLDVIRRTIQPAHIGDITTHEAYIGTAMVAQARARTVLCVPLLKEGEVIGAINIYRQEVRPFTDKQVELLTSFANQAVIAIENARLFEEVQARTRELAKTVEDLEIASQHKSQFVANMSHELRTPLAAVLGYAELMQEGFYEPQGPKSLEALGRIRSNGKHLLGLINTVLDIAKIESGQFKLTLGEYSLGSVVETVRAATEALAEAKKLSLKAEVAKPLPIGIGDEQRLTQVLLNLVGNAIKFTDAGEVRIAATTANGHFAVSVADTGPGIPQEHQARIFEHFHQVDCSLTKAKGGTGLGLAIAKEIVEMHGGHIWVESTLGQGSTFHLELPVRATAVPDVA
jgi:signal transduction histidine kinase